MSFTKLDQNNFRFQSLIVDVPTFLKRQGESDINTYQIRWHNLKKDTLGYAIDMKKVMITSHDTRF